MCNRELGRREFQCGEKSRPSERERVRVRAVQSYLACREVEEEEFIWSDGGKGPSRYVTPQINVNADAQPPRRVQPPKPAVAAKPAAAAPPPRVEVAPKAVVKAPPAPAVVEAAPVAVSRDAELTALCEHIGCEHLMDGPLSSSSLSELRGLARAPLLIRLKELGVAKLPERQAIAGAVAKAATGAPVAKKKNTFEADYIILGGGMTGVGIAAELLDYRKAKSIIILDRLEKLGGHWLYAYPYVHLHNFTSYYTLYGYQWPEYIRNDLEHRASRQEIIDYFGTIQRVFESKPNLDMRFRVEVPSFKPAPSGGGYIVTVQDLNNPNKEPTQLFARTLIDCTTSRMGSAPPHKPMIGECANNIYPNQIEQMDIPTVARDRKRIAVIGGGKTGADEVVHLVRSGVDVKNIVWVKKYDLSFGKREKAQDAFASAEQRAANPLCPLLLTSHLKFKNGVPKFWSLEGRGGSRRLGYTVLPPNHPKNDSPYLNHTGGGMLDDEELALLRQIEQVVGIVVGNQYKRRGALTIDTNVEAYAKGMRGQNAGSDTRQDIPYDWAVWCHGYSFSNYEKLNAKRGKMCMGMLSPGLFYPINWWGSASQGGRIMGRFLMMYEDGLLDKWIQFKFILLQKFLDKYSGPFNTALLYTRSALMESFAYYVISTTTKYGRPYASSMHDVPWFSKKEVHRGAKDEVYWYLHIDQSSDAENEKLKQQKSLAQTRVH